MEDYKRICVGIKKNFPVTVIKRLWGLALSPELDLNNIYVFQY